MPAFDVGRVCVKTSGRDAGKRCVVVDLMDKNFALVTGPKEVSGVRRRRVNVNHLTPLDEKVAIEKGASDEQVVALLKK
ncbi:TPA: 50S ribosomal protein L14e [Candidatus Bathyarchaeota archaeon]|nr:50S ribosomal protein L14e [Candidatus Bathyarchaeota archaeon]